MSKNYKIFVSHAWAHSQDLLSLQSLLNSRGYLNVEFTEATKDIPINSQNANYIKTVLKTKIQSSDIILALAGVYATHSEWMTWELDTALGCQIPIIGVIPWGQEKISSVVYSRSKTDVRWNTESIVEAIRKYAK
ncbi:hypothetical protein J2Y38_003167 [Flavobacterium sp. 2755]|uniref:TIR domain-containing protein n=1 Tax=Flavobacterium sp. 2755 TaxID=2817765 RepID=UPI002865FA1A|nr:TIR domain-containing protein [Flavobacterium sp. 2755]MDR6762949.1 hypothetical protein [Flavobacterium sp. 2755]